MQISETNTEILKQYLLNHEMDISIEWEDFGELAPIFTEIIGREPDEEVIQ